MDKNNELLEAFINWFMREYSNFGGKPISERYEEAFDTFNNDFIDARYEAFQDGWKAQQAKVEELQKRIDIMQEKINEVIDYIGNEFDDFYLGETNSDIHKILTVDLEQALKGESND